MLNDQQIIAKYGQPGDVHKITRIELPYPMRIAWKPETSVKFIQCHDGIAVNLLLVFKDILEHYGYEEVKRLGIDLFGGCVNVRLMRGSKTKWSRHSWGIAIDLDPARNGLRVHKPVAQFSKPEYKEMIGAFYNYGFEGLGPEEDRDWMHFQINS